MRMVPHADDFELVLRVEVVQADGSDWLQRDQTFHHLADWAEAQEICEESIYKAWLYLVDLVSNEEVLLREFP